MFIKFCGFTRPKDVEFAATLPVSAVGFIFHPPSKRNISPEKASELGNIARKAGIQTVGVFVQQPAQEIRNIAQTAKLDMLQIYNYELFTELKTYCPLLCAYRIQNESDYKHIRVPDSPHLLLLDAYHSGKHGGTGHTFDWNILDHLPSLKRIVIAGGIKDANIKELLEYCYPYGIDLSSGIEKAPGIKDANKMRSIIQKIQESIGPVQPIRKV